MLGMKADCFQVERLDKAITKIRIGGGKMNKTTVSQQGASAEIRRRDFRRFYTMVLLWVFCSLLYYFGELVDFFGWEALRWDFFYSVHDVHRLFFLAPIIYAGYFFGVRAAIIITIVVVNTFLPRALFISPFPDPLLRTVLFIIIAGALGYLTGHESERRKHLEALVRNQSNTMFGILQRMVEGILITGPDYKIRFMNSTMIRDFGDSIGAYCYEYLHRLDAPCHQICRLQDVVNGAVARWEYNLPDGRTCEVLALPYVDSDGIGCQLAIIRDIT